MLLLLYCPSLFLVFARLPPSRFDCDCFCTLTSNSELARRYSPIPDVWDPDEFVDGVTIDGSKSLFYHPPNVTSDHAGGYVNYFHPAIFEDVEMFVPKKTLMAAKTRAR